MKRRLTVPSAVHAAPLPGLPRAVAVACVAAVALSGCGILESAAAGGKPAATTPAPGSGARTESGAAVSGLGSVKDNGDLPDPCTLLTEDNVADLTGRTVTQIDRDDAESGAATRFCQWQQEGGQLALFLSRTTEADFEAQISDAETIDGVGDEAFLQANHLYVRYGSVQIDVYSHGGTEADNLSHSKDVANAVIPRI